MNDKKPHAPVDFNQTMKMVKNNPGMVGRGVLFLFICSMIFMTFFAFIALYFFSATEQKFLDNATETQAIVNSVKQERFYESHSVSGSSNQDSYNVNYVSVVSLTFKDQNGQSVTTKTQDGEVSLLAAGDKVKVLHDPGNVEKVILARNKDNASMMRTISYIMGTACVFLFALAFAMTRFEKSRSKK